MAVNQVIVNGEELVNLRNDTVTPETLVEGETATNREGEHIEGELDPVSHDEAYLIDDPEGDIDDSDYIPFNDVSDEEQPKKKTLFSSIVAKLRGIFATKTGDNIADKDTFRQNIHTLEWLGTDIPDNSDLNTYTTAGNYRVVSDASGATIANLPLALCGKVIVFNNGNGGIEQFYFANHSPRIFVRTKFGSDAWSAWKELGEGGDSKPHSYEGGTDIPVNSDLNNYLTVGVYDISNDATAQTIANIPYSHAGKVIVYTLWNSPNYMLQKYEDYDCNMFVRYYVASRTPSWGEWQKVPVGEHTYKRGTPIPAGSDLDDYMVAGVYFIGSDSASQSIDNVPVQNAGKLIVVESINSSNYRIQMYQTLTGRMWVRYYSLNESGWHNWKEIASSDDAYLIKNGRYNFLISENDDLNTYTTGGTYDCLHATTAVTLINCPVSVAFKLMVDVENNPNILTQTITIINEKNTLPWRRGRDSSGSWGTWKQLASTDDISPSTVGNGYAVATVSGSAITATISGFKLRAGVIIALNTIIPQNATLNINNTGAKNLYWYGSSNIDTGDSKTLNYAVYTIIYDGTNYRIIGYSKTPTISDQSYVADTSGSIALTSGVIKNAFQIKYNLSNDKLVWNYYKNSAWRGDKALIDVVGHQTMEGWLGLKTNGGRTIASGAHSLAVSDTIPNILNELRYSNGAWGSFNLGTAYTLNGTTIPTGWYNYFYMPHRVGGENWATPTTWDSDNVNYGTLMLFGMNNTNGVFRVRMNPSDGSSVPVEVIKMADQNDTGASIAKIGKSIIPIWDKSSNVYTYNGITYTFNPTDGTITVNGTATALSFCILSGVAYKYYLSKGNYVLSGCPSGGASNKYALVLQYLKNGDTTLTSQICIGSEINFSLDKDATAVYDSSNNGSNFYIKVENGQTVSNLVFKPMLRPAFTTAEYEPCEDIHKGNCYVGTCSTAGATKDKVAYVDGYFVLRRGVRIAIKFSNTNTYSNTTSSPITLNVNDTGAKNIWYNSTHSGAGNTGTGSYIYGEAGKYFYFVYDGTYWVWDGRTTDSNTTYNPNTLGFGYGTCTTAEATTAKLVTLANYNLISGGYVTVRFDYAVPANATMNINSKGAKGIYYHGTAIKAGMIMAGDRATFVYDGTNYQLVGIDRISFGRHDCLTMSSLKWGTVASTLVKTDNNYTIRGDIIGGVLYFNMEINFKANGTLPSYASENGGIFMILNITTLRWRMAHAEYNNSYISCYTTSTTYDGSTGLMFMLRRTLAVTTGASLKVCFEVPVNGGVTF